MAFKAEDFKDDPDFKQFIDSTVASSIESAVGDLKNKNSELIGEKKKLAEKLSSMDGIDPEAARKALDFMSNNEIAKLISEGKTDEALSSYTEKLRATYEEKIAAISEDIEKSKNEANTYKTRYEISIIDSEIRKEALKQGILPEALDDVILRARQIFTYGEDGTIEARDKDGNLMKVEDKLLTSSLWVKDLPRHYWPASDGAGAQGGQKGDTDAQLSAAASSGDLAKYRKLRSKK